MEGSDLVMCSSVTCSGGCVSNGRETGGRVVCWEMLNGWLNGKLHAHKHAYMHIIETVLIQIILKYLYKIYIIYIECFIKYTVPFIVNFITVTDSQRLLLFIFVELLYIQQLLVSVQQ